MNMPTPETEADLMGPSIFTFKDTKMNAFEKMAAANPKCDLCGKPMIVSHGGGWDNDMIYCPDYSECGAEIVFPTSTEYSADKAIADAAAELDEDCAALEYPLAKRLLRALRVTMQELNDIRAEWADMRAKIEG